MRVSKQVMADNNAKIIEKAAFLFREKGIDATSVNDVMEAVGLTHGGFYRHFESKDDLVVTTIKKGFDDFACALEKSIIKKSARQATIDYVHRYLSEQHVANPGKGCFIAALGAEIERKTKAHQSVMTQGTEQLVCLLAQGIDGESSQKHDKAIGLLAVLVGTLILARNANTKNTVEEILSSGKSLAELYIG